MELHIKILGLHYKNDLRMLSFALGASSKSNFLVLSSLRHQSPVLWHVDQGKQGEVRLRPPPIRLPGHQRHQQHLHCYPHLGLAMYQSHQFHSYDYIVISIYWSLGHHLPYMIADFFSKNKFSPLTFLLICSKCFSGNS